MSETAAPTAAWPWSPGWAPAGVEAAALAGVLAPAGLLVSLPPPR